MLAIVPLLRKLEHSAAEGDLSEAPKLVDGIHGEFVQILAFLEDYQKTHNSVPQLKAS
jgi:hypothetical protein